MLSLNFNLISAVSEVRHITVFFDSLMWTTYNTKMKILLVEKNVFLGFWSVWTTFTLGILGNFFRKTANLLFTASL